MGYGSRGYGFTQFVAILDKGGGSKGGLGKSVQYRFPISMHPHRPVSSTCRRHVSVLHLPLRFKIVLPCALTSKTNIATVVRWVGQQNGRICTIVLFDV